MSRRLLFILLQRLRMVTLTLTVCYAFLVAGLALIWALGMPGSALITLSNIFALYFFVPVVPLFLLGFWLHSRAFWLALSVPLLLFALLFGNHLLPPKVPANEPAIRLLTMNVLYSNERYEEVARFILAAQPDILALQEVEPELAEVLDRRLAEQYPYRALPLHNDDLSMAVLSRFPIIEQSPGHERIQELTLVVDGQAVKLINAHPRAPRVKTRSLHGLPLPVAFQSGERDATLENLIARIDATGNRPLIVLGDFNLTEREAFYAELAARLDDAFDAAGWGFGNTFPSRNGGPKHWAPFPLVRIDYVWSSQHLPAQAVTVRCELPGSDHCALMAELGRQPVSLVDVGR